MNEGQEVHAGFHQCHLETERIVARRVVEVHATPRKQLVQRAVPVVQVFVIDLVCQKHHLQNVDKLQLK